MSPFANLAELRQVTGHLQQCVTALMSKYGDSPAIRRVANDTDRIGNAIDRLEIDLHELEPMYLRDDANWSREVIQIPDTQYDVDFWRDVDHEGIGGQNGACVHVLRNRKAR
ncbi:hypothetical protein A5784_13550 [Mycobacterium sp. 852013-50091_SCH5140682]|uniref:hypothetical protein n=1 Tax=Mycobacterium sp. 852013-50091_SCH5140682 TaxID=1834109 RepID=UPI0007EABF39|nr:hypothetical protein [Mycobacterium sp. 852013-50091_SCH5140682]OBC04578.1 hypothetical protein A5784_13550 [Mycobacterium sp. 852013-50091_SCH5140682]